MSFKGFFTVNELNDNPNLIPDVKGVYKVVFQGVEPEFLTQGTCGRFKDREPNVSVNVLKDNWIDGADVVYIGKAGSPTGQATL